MTLSPPEPPLPFYKKPVFRLANLAVSAAVLLGLAAGSALAVGMFAAGPLTEGKTIVVSYGAGVSDIASILLKENAVYAKLPFRFAARLAGSLKAGEYALPAGASAFDIARLIHEGHSIARTFTAAEGLTSAEIVRMLEADPALSGNIDGVPPEGSLLPETYRYSYMDSRSAVILRMQRAMREKTNALWATREGGLAVTSIEQALVLASIVEKETGKAEERAKIAGVFYNRLRRGMRLQSDPTVIYALTQGKSPLNRSLTHADLATPSPINTYASDGLPPQPICNPGSASIHAALHPEHHDFLYFVADGTGGHVFSPDLMTHNKNVSAWRSKLRNAARP
ncbi:MAG: endolytic transglycosylase MltG [Alphaproteobacteria bacterium]|nr:endolytic transglycosylase MltG [Alphaproteobacteria bacterium]